MCFRSRRKGWSRQPSTWGWVLVVVKGTLFSMNNSTRFLAPNHSACPLLMWNVPWCRHLRFGAGMPAGRQGVVGTADKQCEAVCWSHHWPGIDFPGPVMTLRPGLCISASATGLELLGLRRGTSFCGSIAQRGPPFPPAPVLDACSCAFQNRASMLSSAVSLSYCLKCKGKAI